MSRIFDEFLDLDEELHRLEAVDDAMVVAERHVHHRPDDDLSILRDGTLLDEPEAGIHALAQPRRPLANAASVVPVRCDLRSTSTQTDATSSDTCDVFKTEVAFGLSKAWRAGSHGRDVGAQCALVNVMSAVRFVQPAAGR